MKPVLTVFCPSLTHRQFLDQTSIARMCNLPIEFIMFSDNDYRSTGEKTRLLIDLAFVKWHHEGDQVAWSADADADVVALRDRLRVMRAG